MKVRVHCVLVFLFVLTRFYTFSQSCDCPPVASCGACVGGLKSLSLRYTGASGVTVRVLDGATQVFMDVLSEGQEFSFTGTNPNDKFTGTTLSIYINGFLHTTIQTACSGGTFVKSVYGLFTVTAGTSLNGGALCCAPGTTDMIPPVITNCPANITQPLVSGCSRSVSWTSPSVSDNCGVASFTSTAFPGSIFTLGTTTVTYTALDIYNNSATCVFTVTVTDNIPPVINGTLDNITLSAGPNCRAVAAWTPPTASDNCSVSSLVSSHNPGQEFDVGSTVVTYTARDGSNNVTNRNFTVTVEDNTAPVITNCPQNITIAAGVDCNVTVNWTPPTASDNCGVTSFTSNRNPGSEFPIGTTAVTYTARDARGNETVCQFNVVVTYNQSPQVISCPENITTTAEVNGEAIVTWDEPTFTIACGTLSVEKSHEPGSSFDVGTTDVIYTASDGLGNSAQCSFTIMVRPGFFEVEIPKLITPNGDGVNDTWEIKNIQRASSNSVTVFDRWGSVIYQATGYNNQSVVWAGQNKNNALVPTGTYFYIVEAITGNEKFRWEGFIEVVQ
ncbi:MAG: HYR domain-containing protein [Cyclobacteriaceae bacterium]|nr:HYR domain-containing protein [Cyclobacteriaceae bacterium]